MKVGYVPLKSAIWDWLDDGDFGQEEIRESTLLRWAMDCVRWCAVQETNKHRVTILKIENSRARLPEDFVSLAQAAANIEMIDPCNCDRSVDPDCCNKMGVRPKSEVTKTRREDVVQWVTKVLGTDYELELNLKCPKCQEDSCSCGSRSIEVEVDKQWQLSNPQIYYNNFNKVGRFGHGSGNNGPYAASKFSPKFKLMSYSNNGFFNNGDILSDCPNVHCPDCYREFTINMPYIEVDFQEGEVLLSYLGRPIDEDGELLIPDHPDIFDAITNHLDHKWYRRKWKREGDKIARTISQEAMQMREQSIGLAKGALDVMEASQFKSYLEKSGFLKRVPKWSMDSMGGTVQDQGKQYGDYLDGKYPRRGRRR